MTKLVCMLLLAAVVPGLWGLLVHWLAYWLWPVTKEVGLPAAERYGGEVDFFDYQI